MVIKCYKLNLSICGCTNRDYAITSLREKSSDGKFCAGSNGVISISATADGKVVFIAGEKSNKKKGQCHWP